MTNSLLENTLARSGDLMASFTRPPSMFTRQCERASGILHPCEVLVNRIGDLSLPRKSVVRLTDRPDMTLDVYGGRKATVQQQQLRFLWWILELKMLSNMRKDII